MSYLILKGSTWHVRMEVPRDVRHVFSGKRNVFKSLKTGSKAEAQKKKWKILCEWFDKIEVERKGVKDHEVESQIKYINETSNILERVFKEVVTEYISESKSVKEIFEEYCDLISRSLSFYSDMSLDLKEEYLKELNDIKKLFLEKNEKVDISFFYNLKNLAKKANDGELLDDMKFFGFNNEQIKKVMTTKVEIKKEHKNEHPITDSNLKKFHEYQKIKKD